MDCESLPRNGAVIPCQSRFANKVRTDNPRVLSIALYTYHRSMIYHFQKSADRKSTANPKRGFILKEIGPDGRQP